MSSINCSVTVMPVYEGKIGFIKRSKGDSYPELLVAPGGKVEETDGELIDGVMYYSVEHAGMRELAEETGIVLEAASELLFFCTLTLPNGRVVISYWAELETEPKDNGTVVWIAPYEIEAMNDALFAPGMKQEALKLVQFAGIS